MSNANDYVYGLHAVRHALRLNPAKVLSVWIQDTKKNNHEINEILKLAAKSGIHHEYVSKNTLDKHAENLNHQGILIKVKRRPLAGINELDEIIENKQPALPLLLILDGIQDPQNLGACIRTADAAGVDAVIIPKDKAVSVNATVSKVASGGVEHTPVITVTNLSRTINHLQEAGVWVVGAEGKADKSLYELDLNMPLAIVLGAEGKGMRANTREHCDYLASLPMHGIVESLNVSVAAGICLYEVIRQRHL